MAGIGGEYIEESEKPSTKIYSLGYLVSGGGSNFKAIDNAIEDGRLKKARSRLVISSHAGAGALEIAKARGIPGYHIDNTTQPEPVDEAILERLEQQEVDLVIMAGYIRKLGKGVLDAFPGRVLNIHPAPLPEFGGQGMHGHFVHEAVLASDKEFTGPTVHLANEEYDEGRILAHWPVPIRKAEDDAELAARVLRAEHEIYWRAIDAMIFRLDNPEVYGL